MSEGETITGVTDYGDARPMTGANDPLVFGTLRIDPAQRRATWPGGKILLEPLVVSVLRVLDAAGGEVVTRQMLIDRCWGGRSVSDDALTRVVARLRRVAAEAPGSFSIVTIPKTGYALHRASGAAPGEPAMAAEENRPLPRRAILGWAGGGIAAAALGSAWVTYHSGVRQRTAAERLIVVLPFDATGTDARVTLMASALTRQLREQLARVAGVVVVAAETSASIGRSADPGAIGRRVGADFVIGGDVRQDRGRVRVTSSIIDSRSGTVLWSHEQDERSDTPFATEDAVTGALLREMLARLDVEPGSLPPTPARRRDARAYYLIEEGRVQFEQARAARMEERTEAAFDHADHAYAATMQALAIDPSDVDALVLLAQLVRSGWTRAMSREPLTPDQRVARSIGYVTRALAIDPDAPSALTALGDYYRRYLWRWAEAETLLLRALARNPSYIEAHWSLAYLLGTTGRAVEALAHARTVLRLDPETTWRRVALPRILYLVGDRAGTYQHYDAELQATPANLFLISEIYLNRLAEGNAAGIEGLIARVDALQRRPASAALTKLLGRLGDAVKALKGHPAALLARIDADVAAFDAALSPSRTADRGRASIDLLFVYAVEYAWAGATDRAFALFGRALQGHSVYWPAILPYGVDPLPAAFRADPRYAALWHSDPELERLIGLRRRAILARTMAGYDPAGRYIRPPSTAL